jgi:NADP-dependent aldehyde dehydrogenase
MGSINPIFILPGKLAASPKELATTLAASITLGVGQFCTNPGLIIGIEGPDLDLFMEELGTAIAAATPGTMLHPGIAKAYAEKRGAALAAQDVATIAVAGAKAQTNQGAPTLASATAEAFFRNPLLHQEVFGPYSLVIQCKHPDELLKVARHLEGQLTTTLMATDADIRNHPRLVRAAQDICGRLILNGVPTGVRVALSMQHGGPFPATTDSRFTSVGADGIKRWARPISYQNWPDHLLPEALRNKNPLNLWRTVNNTLTRDSL